MMFGPPAGDPVDLAAAYAWPIDRTWVRAMMVMTLDGAIVGPDGRSGSISGGADRSIFLQVRKLSDAVLVGASTIRAERYRPMIAKSGLAKDRADLGLAPAPVIVVVSRSLDLPWEEDMFSESTVRPVVVTSSQADPESLRIARSHSEVVVLSGESVDPNELIDTLVDRGLRRIICEGGAHLLAQLSSADLIDEADISISPLFTGGGGGPSSVGRPVPAHMHLAQVVRHEDFLFTKYLASNRVP